MKLLVLPDIHGRQFWREPCKNIEQYHQVIFLGDYLDPYDFEGISVVEAIENFNDILSFVSQNREKVVMLLGNHDMPYYSIDYYKLSHWHCRHSREHHDEISSLFKEHDGFFTIAHVADDILFTHAGCLSDWLDYVFNYKYKDEINLTDLWLDINGLFQAQDGLRHLFMVSRHRGDYDPFGSCLWADIYETYWDSANMVNEDAPQHPIYKVKQVFGHSLRAFEDKDGKIIYGKPVEFRNYKMLDNACAYELDTETFTIKNLTRE